ncbi:MAG: efflux RND transporter periplasmic adaptor subunit [Lentimicrobiaceae bacterium]|nr:efflux RND transporter periplasmic adaptor subunit [Lentimicrobiaceae bacterium]
MKKKTLIRIIIIAAAVLLVVLVVARKMGALGKDDSIKVSTELAEKRTLIETVSANGKIQPETEVKITPYISGEVVELTVKEGADVKQGDLLAKIDPELYQSNFERTVANYNSQQAGLANAKARLEQVKAQFVNAELSYKRSKQLWEQKVISDADWDAARSNYDVARAEVSAAEQNVAASDFGVKSAAASVKEARENLTKTAIYAPTDGTVSKLSVEKGERVAGASQFSAGTELMRIANLNLMEVNVEVNENDIVRVNMYDTALIEVDAYLNRKFKGIVSEIATSANVTGSSVDQVTNFEVKIRVLQESYADLLSEDTLGFSPFRPGMSATVDIQTETEMDVLTIPIQSVTTRADTTGKVMGEKGESQEVTAGGPPPGPPEEEEKKAKPAEEFQEYVFIYDEGVARLNKVKTGIQDNTYIQILEGLEPGTEVITAPYRAITKMLKNGDQVRKVDKTELFTEE